MQAEETNAINPSHPCSLEERSDILCTFEKPKTSILNMEHGQSNYFSWSHAQGLFRETSQ